ncbi:hypothetical protein A2Z67_02445 [Candidatus Woesebacteria bacterium RBG_13_36_22]|uniref:DUF7352 domain-containing protein n=1 Tax=Candidatus Woesebacteria bacterium RBG_13_36_22 TaxID=1802478 RepID=A0A1F7X166_9BACT|nr:MAG: hypothetical protein A2Z67_02445 [Candidatus Woesebacteria bacterium RBG_13_36_22]
MKTIWKYKLSLDNSNDISVPYASQNIRIPIRSVILDVQEQRGIPCLWALVEDTNKIVERHIRIYGTGHKIDQFDQHVYIGTFQFHDYGLVFHVFEFIDK